MGNICRSPIAEVVLRDTLARHGLDGLVTVDSAGTGDWHVGDPMDERAASVLAEHGYDGTRHRASHFHAKRFRDCDLVVAMDRDNLRNLLRIAPTASADVRLMLSFDPVAAEGAEVPDPYYGDREDFVEVLTMIEAAAEGLAKYLKDNLGA
ncbi:low molecular weight protein-tyrosine-phosphatase [Sinosporangium siamense]|uniref:protein-tyrosine-phosphatase n=2 Tax=Sinosporangium siamense TaxID=1367973 RepID=A0A919RFL8_9ACTN|nr:low molecular weight protein-tyrosine-phosphatase [Sinosporangium siamense]